MSFSLPSKIAPEKFREAVLIALFALMSHIQDDEGLIKSIKMQLNISQARSREAFDRAKEIFQENSAIVERFEKICQSYRWARVGKLEQAVLVLGAWELGYCPSIPGKVVLAEATRLAKKFSGVDSARFVNAVLDAYWRNHLLDENLDWCSQEVQKLSEAIQEGAELKIEDNSTHNDLEKLED